MTLKAQNAQLVLALLLCAATRALASWDESCADVSGKLLGRDSEEDDPTKGKIEDGWPMILRLFCYLLGLAYCFYAVGLISDIFMEGIDKVTSKKIRRTETDKEGKTKTTTSYAWNATIANLSLMALGSSAPEIMLGCIEVAGGSFLLGPLGPGVIVGSAAFNLLCISAVCVNAHEDNKVTKIKETPVYIITAFFSVWSYIWLFIIIQVWTPDVVTWPEAIITIIQFPILLVLAYLADRGKITFGIQTEEKGEDLCILEGASKEELAAIEHKIKEQYGHHLTEEQVIGFMKAQYTTRRNKAFYAHVGLQKAVQGKKVDTTYYNASLDEAKKEPGVSKDVETSDNMQEEMEARTIRIGFFEEAYACLESHQVGKFKVIRTGPPDQKVTVKYKTIAGSASEETDYEKVLDKELTFEKDEVEKEIKIAIMNDNAYEEDEDFFVELYDPTCADSTADGKFIAALGPITRAQMTIIDDDLPGKFRFGEEHMIVETGESDEVIEILVQRFDGSSGKIECKYNTNDQGAVAGIDYEEAQGTVSMEDGVMSAHIKINIKATGRYITCKSGFMVTLTEPTCPQGTDAAKAKVGFDKNTDGGEESCILLVELKGKSSETRDRLLSRMNSKLKGSRIAHEKWKQQFIDAATKVIDDDDEDEEPDPEVGGEEEPKGPTVKDYVFHVAAMPWKLLFACVPPTDYCGGWPTFYVALVFIGLVTVLVGDLAELLGCALTIPAEITAITFVALGTSLPDTFASKTAAEMDPYADNSIGNVTGSNSVNVMLGCGLAWTLGALFWFSTKFDVSSETMEKIYNGTYSADYVKLLREDATAATPKELWLEQFQKYDAAVQKNIMSAMDCGPPDFDCEGSSYAFMVPAGTLYFNLGLFSILALIAIAHLALRRRMWSGELGGPKKGFMGQYMSGALLASEWLIYITVSSLVCLEVIKLN